MVSVIFESVWKQPCPPIFPARHNREQHESSRKPTGVFYKPDAVRVSAGSVEKCAFHVASKSVDEKRSNVIWRREISGSARLSKAWSIHRHRGRLNQRTSPNIFSPRYRTLTGLHHRNPNRLASQAIERATPSHFPSGVHLARRPHIGIP
jgi:hypothetical protein